MESKNQRDERHSLAVPGRDVPGRSILWGERSEDTEDEDPPRARDPDNINGDTGSDSNAQEGVGQNPSGPISPQ